MPWVRNCSNSGHKSMGSYGGTGTEKDRRPPAGVQPAHLKAVALDSEDSRWDGAAAAVEASPAAAAALVGRRCQISVSLLLQPATESCLESQPGLRAGQGASSDDNSKKL